MFKGNSGKQWLVHSDMVTTVPWVIYCQSSDPNPHRDDQCWYLSATLVRDSDLSIAWVSSLNLETFISYGVWRVAE